MPVLLLWLASLALPASCLIDPYLDEINEVRGFPYPPIPVLKKPSLANEVEDMDGGDSKIVETVVAAPLEMLARYAKASQSGAETMETAASRTLLKRVLQRRRGRHQQQGSSDSFASSGSGGGSAQRGPEELSAPTVKTSVTKSVQAIIKTVREAGSEDKKKKTKLESPTINLVPTAPAKKKPLTLIFIAADAVVWRANRSLS
jgi:hypothetical protein